MVIDVPAFRNLDIDLLRAFVAIADERNMSRAAERLLRSQSAVSLQLKRLESAIGQPLFERSPRKVKLTLFGETLIDYARRMLALNDEVIARVNEPQLEGVLRLGVPEDFATTYMPRILGEFTKNHPLIALEVTCDLTLTLMEGFHAGRYDMVLVKREPTMRAGGVRVWREPLVWVAADGFALQATDPAPLVVSPEPCVYRKRAIEALKRSGREWRISYTCGSLAGAQAAVRHGLGLSVLPRDMLPPGLHVADRLGLPHLRDTEIALLVTTPATKPAVRLGDHIVASLERVRERSGQV